VHEKFSAAKLADLKREHPGAKVLVHPECPKPVRIMADKVGSTQALLNFAVDDESQEFIVCTESGILFEMQRRCPDKTFIPAPPEDGTCACNECEYMKLITLEKLYNSLKFMAPTIEVDEEIAGVGRVAELEAVACASEISTCRGRSSADGNVGNELSSFGSNGVSSNIGFDDCGSILTCRIIVEHDSVGVCKRCGAHEQSRSK
jgi:hypothetical protein